MILNAIDPITNATMASFEITEKQQIMLYETLIMALDYNPSTEMFASRIAVVHDIIDGRKDDIDLWITALQKITTKVERPGSMCFVLEDWLDEWYIADFIDQRYLVLKFNSKDTIEAPTV